MHLANITSQGQVSIPARLRRKLELEKGKRVLITEKNGKILIEPVKDILDLAGIFQVSKKVKPYKGRKDFENNLARLAAQGISKKALRKLGFRETSRNIFTPPKIKFA